MNIIEAIEKRISCRAFEPTPIEQDKFDALAAEIEAIDAESGFNFQLYGPRDHGTAIDMSPKMFASNPPCYAALVGPAGAIPEEKLGYYGERLVLFAAQLGLSTCWVASTYDKSTTRVELAPDEMLHDVVPIGYAPAKMPLKQRTIRTGLRARGKKPAALWKSTRPLDQEPEWIRACIDAVEKAPSAINEQPVVFELEEPDGLIRAQLPRVKTGMEYTDLGIAKLHFQVVAAEYGINGHWEWGAGGAFLIDE